MQILICSLNILIRVTVILGSHHENSTFYSKPFRRCPFACGFLRPPWSQKYIYVWGSDLSSSQENRKSGVNFWQKWQKSQKIGFWGGIGLEVLGSQNRSRLKPNSDTADRMAVSVFRSDSPIGRYRPKSPNRRFGRFGQMDRRFGVEPQKWCPGGFLGRRIRFH